MEPSTPSAAEVPLVLPFRLEGKSVGAGLGCALICAIVLLGLGSSILFYGSTGADKRWLAWLVGGGMCLMGTLFVWSWITQLFAAGTPATLIELSEHPVRTGAPFQLALLQPGPAAVRSLTVSVTCREITGRVVTKTLGKGRAPRRERMISEKMCHEQVVAAARDVRAVPGDVWRQVYDVMLPVGLPGTATQQTPKVVWELVIVGKLNGVGRFQRTHALKVAEG